MELHVQKKYFDDILKWEKTFEWRLAKDKYRLASIGSEIMFKTTWTKDIIKKKILLKKRYLQFIYINHLRMLVKIYE